MNETFQDTFLSFGEKIFHLFTHFERITAFALKKCPWSNFNLIITSHFTINFILHVFSINSYKKHTHTKWLTIKTY